MNIEDKIAVVVSNDNAEVSANETIDAIVEAGFKNVFIQWYNKDWQPSQAQQLEYIKKTGLNVLFAHLGYQKINTLWEEGKEGDEHILRYQNDLKVCKENGIDLVCMHLTEKDTAPTGFEAGLKRLRAICDTAKELGMRISFENTKVKGYVEYVLEHIQDENVGFCFDCGHYHAHFKDELDFKLFEGRIFAVHLHDNHGEKDEHLLPFDGNMDWEATLRHLAECGYDGPIILELCYRREYLKMPIVEFYKKGYELGEKLALRYEEIKKEIQ